MASTLEELLDDALGCKRKQFLHETVYSHDVIKLWLKSAINVVNVTWNVVIPEFKSLKKQSISVILMAK